MCSDARRALLLTALCLTLGTGIVHAQSPHPRPVFYPDDPIRVDADTRPGPMPAERSATLSAKIKKLLDLPDVDIGIARNINTLGEVPDSSWFVNRHGRREMSEEALARGPDREGPPTDGAWKVVDNPTAGKTPKLTIEDGEGRRFLIKFETPENPEMMSAAEVVCTKFFHAFGYRVPENHIVVFDPARLFVDPELDPQEFPANDLDELLSVVPRTPDGQVRAIASSWLPGTPVGPFSFAGTRPDDPNDVFPHEYRRELRGLRVFSAWLNHSDIKEDNTLDMFVGEDDAGYLRHHLIDFGSCMGSGAQAPKDRLVGYERYVDLDGILRGIFTFGLWRHPAMAIDYPDYPAIGHFEADYYQPWLWQPPIPNPAFAALDAADAFWAASILARFDDQAVDEVVDQGRITDTRQEAYLRETLIRRRDKTVAYWLTRTTPLDAFELSGGALVWDNAAERLGLAATETTYSTAWFRFDNERGTREPLPRAADGPGIERTAPIPSDPWGPADRFGLRYAVVDISAAHPEFAHWTRPVAVTLRTHPDGRVDVVGVDRPREMPEEPAGETQSSAPSSGSTSR